MDWRGDMIVKGGSQEAVVAVKVEESAILDRNFSCMEKGLNLEKLKKIQ